jgi:hypothetical protein
MVKQGDLGKEGKRQYCHYYLGNQLGQEVELYAKPKFANNLAPR